MHSATLFITLFLSAALFAGVKSRIVSKCELFNTLRSHGIHDNLGTWACIAQHESNFNTNAYNSVTGDHGIFQISQLFWCSTGNNPGGACNARCWVDFHDDNINNDVDCVKRIFDEHQRLSGNGFNAWTTYQFCRGDQSGWLNGC